MDEAYESSLAIPSHSLLVSPHSNFRLGWDPCAMLAVVLDLLVAPIEIAFDLIVPLAWKLGL